MRWIVLLIGLEFPALLALLDCVNRDGDEFAGGAPDRAAWLRWLMVGVATAWLLVGNGIVLGYYWSVVKRSRPA